MTKKRGIIYSCDACGAEIGSSFDTCSGGCGGHFHGDCLHKTWVYSVTEYDNVSCDGGEYYRPVYGYFCRSCLRKRQEKETKKQKAKERAEARAEVRRTLEEVNQFMPPMDEAQP